MPWSPSFLICVEAQKVRDLFTQKKRKGKKNRKGSKKEGTEPKLWKKTGQERAEVESFCFSGPWFSSFSLRKADLLEWLGEQMPFIGLSSVTSNRLGQSSPVCPGSHFPSPGSWWFTPRGRTVFWVGVADRARIKNTELGSERGSGWSRKYRVTRSSK